MSFRRVVLFDLDGTITRHDTLTPFAFGYLFRHPWRLPRLVLALPAALGYLVRMVDRGGLKGSLIHAALGGVERARIGRWAEEFLERLFARGLFSDALREITARRSDGALLILMSASPDLYVPLIGTRLRFDRTICSRVRWNDDDTLDGRLAGPNCRDAEKLRQLQALRRELPDARFIAYGNSSADLPHLLAADEGVLVNGAGACLSEAAKAGLGLVRWS